LLAKQLLARVFSGLCVRGGDLKTTFFDIFFLRNHDFSCFFLDLLSFFAVLCCSFPKDEVRRKAWEDWVETCHVVGVTKITEKHGLCSAHCTKKCYKFNSRRLKEDAMPTIVPE